MLLLVLLFDYQDTDHFHISIGQCITSFGKSLFVIFTKFSIDFFWSFPF